MLDAARVCQTFSKNKKRVDLEHDRMLAFAVVRALEIFGEAASKISKSIQGKYPHIEWKAIIGMRNRLIHAYFDIDYDIVWEAIHYEIPKIIPQIEKLISQMEE